MRRRHGDILPGDRSHLGSGVRATGEAHPSRGVSELLRIIGSAINVAADDVACRRRNSMWPAFVEIFSGLWGVVVVSVGCGGSPWAPHVTSLTPGRTTSGAIGVDRGRSPQTQHQDVNTTVGERGIAGLHRWARRLPIRCSDSHQVPSDQAIISRRVHENRECAATNGDDQLQRPTVA